MILIIDNYDSFVYNLAQYLGELGYEPLVSRNDKITVGQIEKMTPSHIVISPGPCTPLQAGVSNDVISCFSGKIPILGVCLGHQCIGHVFGAVIKKAPLPVHGKSSLIFHNGTGLYEGLFNPFEAGRYHSLVVEKTSLPPCLHITASTCDGLVMGLKHSEYPVEGVQFHPESILTASGHAILQNFLAYSSDDNNQEAK
ncbi:MAG: aminodeoxychorismate/anthranilate synthase component II [Dehalococcoidaceae bacterium]|nr:aminodeoxychorismate/anthranilate synthase component II [Dehalococcoidaceae bacterium]